MRLRRGNEPTVAEELRLIRKEVHALQREQTTMRRAQAAELKRQREVLRLLYDDEPGMRRRLYELRKSPEYELAYEEPDPLVSVVIPTPGGRESLGSRSLPSVLGQTYENLEVIVVGDRAPEETAEVVAGFGDPRLSYFNRNVRGPYPSDPKSMWRVGGVPPFNDGVAQARGRWLAAMSDDDAMRPDHVETLLGAAREARHEVSYGLVCCILPDGRSVELGEFPPASLFYAQASIGHAGLRFMQAELADALFDESSDRSMARRALRVGVRHGFVEQVVTDYYWHPRFPGHGFGGHIQGALDAKYGAETSEASPRSASPSGSGRRPS
jgi:hypothetical protein